MVAYCRQGISTALFSILFLSLGLPTEAFLFPSAGGGGGGGGGCGYYFFLQNLLSFPKNI